MRRHFFALFGGIALLATLIPAGSAAWMFSLEEATDSANVLVQGDPIRDNHVLGDDNDPDYAGQTFYDVYFAAQVTPQTSLVKDDSQGPQILDWNQSSFSTDHAYYRGEGESGAEPKLGRFEMAETHVSAGTQYYRVFSQKTSITHAELEEINSAFRSEVIDRTTGQNGETFPLSLIGWTPMLVCNFALGNETTGGVHLHWPTLDNLKDNRWTGSVNNDYIRVDGYYPNDPTLVLFSANTLLAESYSNYVRDIDGNGRDDLVLYPILSTGKNNHAADQGETLTDAIGVDLFPGEGSDMGGQGSNATYDPQLSQAVRSQVSGGTRIEVFRYENVLFEEGSGSSLGFTLDPNRSSGNKYGVGAGWPGTEESGRWDGDSQIQKSHASGSSGNGEIDHDEDQRFYIAEADSKDGATADSITGLSGRYNIYFVDLINDDQTLNETSGLRDWPDQFTANNGLALKEGNIKNAFEERGVTPYQIRIIEHTKLVTTARYTSSWGKYTYYAQTRALAIVLERVYEPRLVLGDTGSASFSNGKAFTQVAGPTQHTYTLMNVNLDGETTYNVGNAQFSNDIFAIQLANQESFTTYQMKPGEAGPSNSSGGYDYGDFSGTYFETFTYTWQDGSVMLVRPNEGSEGSYDLLITVEMAETTDGVNVPSAVKIYGRRRAVYYVNVSTDTAIENAPTHDPDSGSLAGFVNTSIYNYRFEAFHQSEALTPETSFVSKDGTSAKAFADILEEVYRSTGSYLQDITTGRIFTPMEFYEGSGATYEPQGSMALYLWKPGN